MNYCRECGKILEGDKEECPFCGTKIDIMTNLESTVGEGSISDEVKQNEESPAIENQFSCVNYEDNNHIDYKNTEKPPVKPLSNWIKVLLSFLIPLLPGLGSITGIIASIIFMTNEDQDRKTFGYALLSFSIIFLVIICACCMMLGLLTSLPEMYS
ncbi:MAG: hypothetical protein GX308_06170 [Epulopiscium sp.]|nr:hypothetical protein [Candidatus Epulonipiscium sp.]